MTLAAKGLAKLIEECGELQQIAGKRLAYYTTEDHPDGGRLLSRRLEDEIADVLAACEVVIEINKLNRLRISVRTEEKRAVFRAWHTAVDNNEFGIDADARGKKP